MTKQSKQDIVSYTKAERKAEAEIDRFLQRTSPPSARSILEQLRDFD